MSGMVQYRGRGGGGRLGARCRPIPIGGGLKVESTVIIQYPFEAPLHGISRSIGPYCPILKKLRVMRRRSQ